MVGPHNQCAMARPSLPMLIAMCACVCVHVCVFVDSCPATKVYKQFAGYGKGVDHHKVDQR